MDMSINKDVSAGGVEVGYRQPTVKEQGQPLPSPESAGVPISDEVDVQIGGLQHKEKDEVDPQSAEKKSKTEEEKLKNMTQAMNEFMEKMNCDIKFEMHQETKRMMVQVVSRKDGKVLKQFPPKEMLDVLANISKSIGLILDKKA